MLNVTFFGVRGSTPSPSPDNVRYGGNTACVVLEAHGADPLILDLGTGLRAFGDELPESEPFRGTAFLTHMHWDHVQGLPFFTPILRDGSELVVYGPAPEEASSLAEAFATFMRPPYFPVTVEDLLGEIVFRDLGEGSVQVGALTVTARCVPHTGLTYGYRIDAGGASVAYVSDHQQPYGGSLEVDEAVLSLCAGVDLLIHDAQFTDSEFAEKLDWGHCTVEYAVNVASKVGASCLALFHHDPLHDDHRLDCLAATARGLAGSGFEVIAAAEGLTVSLGE